MEYLLSGFLRYGALLACASITFGLALHWSLGESATLSLSAIRLIAAGVALIILLPVMRVALMMAVFFWQKDYIFTGIAGTVLGIIAGGFLWGITHVG